MMEHCQHGQKFVSVQLVSHCKDWRRAWWPDSSCGWIYWTMSPTELSRTTKKHWSCAPGTWSWMCLTTAGVSKDWRRAWRQIHLVARASNFLVFAQQSSQQMSSVIFVHFFLGWKLSIVIWAKLAFQFERIVWKVFYGKFSFSRASNWKVNWTLEEPYEIQFRACVHLQSEYGQNTHAHILVKYGGTQRFPCLKISN